MSAAQVAAHDRGKAARATGAGGSPGVRFAVGQRALERQRQQLEREAKWP